ncbi:MAG: glycosyltransferase family 4 protein [Spartobacteria bacterium]
MKILVSSHAFGPSIGGIETVSALLASEFVRLRHEVTVVTQTASEKVDDLGYRVLRQPSLFSLGKAIRWCDLFWQNNLSLRTLGPALAWSKPIVITHQGSYCRRPAGIDLVQRLKHFVVGRTTSVAISEAVAACFATRSRVIHNPYDARMFSQGEPSEGRAGELIFVGRLVAEKGVDLLLHALGRLRGSGLSPSLKVVGAGPELSTLQRLAADLGLVNQVVFAGPRRGEELVRLLRQHRVLVVPSRYDEPFGVVALEGIACGCVAVGSAGGGLPEAIGPCGPTFPNGDLDGLVEALESLLRRPNEHEKYLAAAPQHLARFHPETIAEQYLTLFRSKLA